MSFLLKITSEKNHGEEFLLNVGENLVGRSRSANIRVFNEDVSGKHFVVEILQNSVILHNLSHYGTQVDGVTVQDSTELQIGENISAGRNLSFVLLKSDDADSGEEENEAEGVTSVTKFVSDLPSDEVTGVAEAPDASEVTSVTRFVSDLPSDEVTGVAEAPDASEVTSVTRFVSDLPSDEVTGTAEAPDASEVTSVTRFVSDLPSDEVTGVAEAPDASETTSSIGEATVINHEIDCSEGDNSTSWAKVEQNDDFSSLTVNESVNSGVAAETGEKNSFDDDADNLGDETKLVGESSIETKIQHTDGGEHSYSGTLPYEEQGMFFEDDIQDDSEKTNANETQVVKTRMASLDEMNFIKNQIKKSQQKRLFLKFLLFVVLVVLLGLVWMMRRANNETDLSWPHKVVDGKEVYFEEVSSWLGYEEGGFSLYFPACEKNNITQDDNTISVTTYLGRNQDVPLSLILQREESLDFVYESRENAIQAALKRLTETADGIFNFESMSIKSFLSPLDGDAGNGVQCDNIFYQRDKDISWFGILRFFRSGKYNYMLRVEVPASEKQRAMNILGHETFLFLSAQFVQSHWEGSDRYMKLDVPRALVSVKDELMNRDSAMMYAKLEIDLKSILAQCTYNEQNEHYSEAMDLLIILREKQQNWYKAQRVNWASASCENNSAKKRMIRSECEAVFSLVGDKRQYDILRDYWE